MGIPISAPYRELPALIMASKIRVQVFVRTCTKLCDTVAKGESRVVSDDDQIGFGFRGGSRGGKTEKGRNIVGHHPFTRTSRSKGEAAYVRGRFRAVRHNA